MKKHVFHLTLSVAVLFILTACGGNNYIYTTQVQALPQQQYIPNAVDYHKPDIISFGRQSAEEFLLGYISLFSLGYYENGNFFVWDYYHERSATFNYIPLVYVVYGPPTNWYNGTVFDRYGDIILDDVPFLKNGLIARDFTLFDIDGNGIPEIFILYVAETWGSGVLYRFVDGAFRGMGLSWYPQFYIDEDGQAFMVDFDYDWVYKSYITFTSGGMEFSEPLRVEYDEWVASVIQIHPLEDMHEAITELIMQRLGINNSTTAFLPQEEVALESYDN